MEDNFINAYANNDVNNLMTPSITSYNGKRAVLFIFSPRHIEDHYKRPLLYNFNMEFSENAANLLVGGNNKRNLSQLLASNVSNGAIVPSMTGIKFNTSMYSNQWSFLLIVTNDDVNPAIQQMNSGNRKCIYIGLFTDEPVNPNTLNFVQPTINPNSTLVITRKLILNRLNTFHATRGKIVKDDLMSDVENYYHDENIINQNDHKLFNIQPNNIIKKSMPDQNGGIALTDHNGFDSPLIDPEDSKLETVQNSPKKQLGIIGKALLSSLDYYDYESIEQEMLDVDNNYSETLKENAEAFMNNNCFILSDNIGLKNNRYSLGEIINRYNPDIYPIISPAKTGAQIIPQDVNSPTSIFSSLITATIPSFLTRVGLSGVSFMYNSYYDAMKLLHIESLIPVEDSKLKFKWESLLKILKFELFQIIEASVGPFDLMVNSFINGSSYVRLQLLDESVLPSDYIFEENNTLGGITSPGIGNFDSFANNSRDLNNFINYVADKNVDYI